MTKFLTKYYENHITMNVLVVWKKLFYINRPTKNAIFYAPINLQESQYNLPSWIMITITRLKLTSNFPSAYLNALSSYTKVGSTGVRSIHTLTSLLSSGRISSKSALHLPLKHAQVTQEQRSNWYQQEWQCHKYSSHLSLKNSKFFVSIHELACAFLYFLRKVVCASSVAGYAPSNY
jgi:hypothetical protein